jgi:pyrimidine-nucleoside phosphorylase
MLAASLLVKKRDGEELTDEEIRFLIEGFCSGEVADYQMAAFAMAVCLRGMTPRETATLTRAMWESGDTLPRDVSNQRSRPRADKHSTGGLGDKVSLILAPLLALFDIDVPMISGRGLGLTGGTLDKLESIEGFRTDLSVPESAAVLQQVGAFIVGASQQIAPADRRLYALRDVTGTVESVPLITASILSKKLAANLDALVMDVKVGSGAFMKTNDQAFELCESIIRVGKQAGLPTTAIVTDMDQPLGAAVGNAIEVNESIDVLQGGGPGEVREVTVELGANLLLQFGRATDRGEAIKRLTESLTDGSAYERFQAMIAAQGGKLRGRLPLADQHVLNASQSGFVQSLACETIGTTVVAMGGGRRKVGDRIDHRVGVEVQCRVGDAVQAGQPILTAYCQSDDHAESLQRLSAAVTIVPEPVQPKPLIVRRFD